MLELMCPEKMNHSGSLIRADSFEHMDLFGGKAKFRR